MAKEFPVPVFWKHVIAVVVLSLCLFPILPLYYLIGISVYYGGRYGWKFRWYVWKPICVGILSIYSSVGMLIFLYGLPHRRLAAVEDEDAQFFVCATVFVPFWLAVFYLPSIWRKRAIKRAAERAVAMNAEKAERTQRQNEEYQHLNERKAAEIQTSKSIEDAVEMLEVKRRELFRLYLSHKSFLDDREWDEKTFINFEEHKRDLLAGKLTAVNTRLQLLQSSLERAGIIGRLRSDYKQRQAVIGSDISEMAFESLLAGIPLTGDFHSACDDVQAILVQAYNHRAAGWKESQSEQHLDNLLESMDVPADHEQSDIVPLKRRTS